MGRGKRKGKEQGREGRQFDEMGGAMTVGVQGEGKSVAYGVAHGRRPNKRVSQHPHTQTTTIKTTTTTADRTPTHNPSSPYDPFFLLTPPTCKHCTKKKKLYKKETGLLISSTQGFARPTSAAQKGFINKRGKVMNHSALHTCNDSFFYFSVSLHSTA